MKWIDGLTWSEKQRRKKIWHRWFAWYPIRIGETEDGHKIKIWLQYIWRKGYHSRSWEYSFWTWEYAEVKPDESILQGPEE
jgi:hypothetical protein